MQLQELQQILACYQSRLRKQQSQQLAGQLEMPPLQLPIVLLSKHLTLLAGLLREQLQVQQ
jgi:hypothetical protein